LSPNTAGR